MTEQFEVGKRIRDTEYSNASRIPNTPRPNEAIDDSKKSDFEKSTPVERSGILESAGEKNGTAGMRFDNKKKEKSYLEYVKDKGENLWMYSLLAVSLLTPVLAFVDRTFPYSILRWLFGSLDFAFVPGYAILWILFPRQRELDAVERLALSVIVSVAAVSLIGFVLNLSPFGLALAPFAIILTVLNVCTLAIASIARYRVISRPI